MGKQDIYRRLLAQTGLTGLTNVYTMLAICIFVNWGLYVQYPRAVVQALAMLNFVAPPTYVASWSMALTGSW